MPGARRAVDEVAAAIADLRTIAAGVRPPRLDEGSPAALADLARGAASRSTSHASRARARPAEIEAAAYFVACEALTNAVKHGSPTRVVRRDRRARAACCACSIADDGVGGAGAGRRHRARRACATASPRQGGTLAIDSPPGAGTRIAVELPCGS